MKYLFFLIVVVLFSCSKQVYTADTEVSYIRIDSKVKASSTELEKIIQPYRAQLGSVMEEEIAFTEEELFKRKPAGTLGNWFVDAFLDATRLISKGDSIDLAFQNYGGIRISSLAAGPITVGDVYELMPFDNEVYILTLDSVTLQLLFDEVAAYGGWPLSGATFNIQDTVAVDVLINGAKFTNKKKYTVALPDYIANGGGNCSFLIASPREEKGVLIRDLIIDYYRNIPVSGKMIKSISENRINVKE